MIGGEAARALPRRLQLVRLVATGARPTPKRGQQTGSKRLRSAAQPCGIEALGAGKAAAESRRSFQDDDQFPSNCLDDLRYGVARRASCSSGFEDDLLQDACQRLLGYCGAKLLGQPFKPLRGVLLEVPRS